MSEVISNNAKGELVSAGGAVEQVVDDAPTVLSKAEVIAEILKIDDSRSANELNRVKVADLRADLAKLRDGEDDETETETDPDQDPESEPEQEA